MEFLVLHKHWTEGFDFVIRFVIVSFPSSSPSALIYDAMISVPLSWLLSPVAY